jgi:hypothetical protein
MAKKKTINNVNNDVSPIMMISIFVIFIVAMIFVTYFGMNLHSPVSKYFSPYNTIIENDLQAVLNQQKEFDKKIESLSKDGGYTLDSPLIIKSPYHINKLTALAIFNTEEDTRVELKINDKFVTNMERSKYHIIPIYGLFADVNNTVTFTLEDGKTKTFDIMVGPYNNELNGLDVTSQLKDEDTYYLVGDINSPNSTLRGFDKKNNLNSYLELGYIGGLTVFKNKISIAYNQNKESVYDLRLDLDYLGRITNITPNTAEINYTSNISGDGIEYIGDSSYFYGDLTANYSFNELVNNESYTNKQTLVLSESEKSLSSAVKYEQPLKISYMNDYISYASDIKGELLIVTRDGGLYSYPIDGNGIIRTDIKGDKSLYIKVDNIIYSLKTTLVDNTQLK